MCYCVSLIQYWEIVTVPGFVCFVYLFVQVCSLGFIIFFFFIITTTTVTLALQLQQKRIRMVRSNGVALRRPGATAFQHGLPAV